MAVRFTVIFSLFLLLSTIQGRLLINDSPSSPKIIKEENKVMMTMMVGGGMGSRPPSCERICKSSSSTSCGHCQAVQVPTSISVSLASNIEYRPITWKCKCGSTLFNP